MLVEPETISIPYSLANPEMLNDDYYNQISNLLVQNLTQYYLDWRDCQETATLDQGESDIAQSYHYLKHEPSRIVVDQDDAIIDISKANRAEMFFLKDCSGKVHLLTISGIYKQLKDICNKRPIDSKEIVVKEIRTRKKITPKKGKLS